MVKMIIYKDEVFGFFEIFNEENGTLFRSDINGVDPVMRSFPELLDVGIMGHCNGGQYCRNAGIDCYQKGFTTYAPHMSYENFMEIVKQAAGKTFQIQNTLYYLEKNNKRRKTADRFLSTAYSHIGLRIY